MEASNLRGIYEDILQGDVSYLYSLQTQSLL